MNSEVKIVFCIILVKQEEGTSSSLDSGNVQVKEELNEPDGFGQSGSVPSTNAQQQQQQQQTTNVNKQSNNAEVSTHKLTIHLSDGSEPARSCPGDGSEPDRGR